METLNPRFLQALAKLIKQFKEPDFRQLAELLTDTESREKIINMLLSLAETSRRRSEARKKKPRVPIEDRLRNANPDRFPMLREVLQGISSKVFLFAAADLKDACTHLGISTNSKTSRSKMAESITMKLAQMSDQEFLQFRERFLHPHKGSENEYAIWTKLILNK